MASAADRSQWYLETIVGGLTFGEVDVPRPSRVTAFLEESQAPDVLAVRVQTDRRIALFPCEPLGEVHEETC